VYIWIPTSSYVPKYTEATTGFALPLCPAGPLVADFRLIHSTMASYRPESISMEDLETNSAAEREQTLNAGSTLLQPISSRPPPLERKLTQSSYSSSSPLSPTPPTSPTRHAHAKSPSRSSPFYWNLPPQVSAWEEKRTQTVQRMPKGPTKFWHGWKVIVFGSCTYLPCSRNG